MSTGVYYSESQGQKGTSLGHLFQAFTHSSPGSLCFMHVNNSVQRFDDNICGVSSPRWTSVVVSGDHLCLRGISVLAFWWDVCHPPPCHQIAPSADEGTSWLSPQRPARSTLLRVGSKLH